MLRNSNLRKSFLTVMSILSVLAGFFVICLLTLFLLESAGVFSFSFQREEVTAPSPSEGLEGLPVRWNSVKKAENVVSELGASEDVLLEMPFIRSYYLSLRVESGLSDGVFAEGVYEIWRSEEKYRIHRYSLVGNELEHIVLCNGKAVQITDFETASIISVPYDREHSFSAVAPIPDPMDLFVEFHIFRSYEELGETVRLSCAYPEDAVVDLMEYVRETGLLVSYRRMHGEETLLSVVATEMDPAYPMADYIFAFE